VLVAKAATPSPGTAATLVPVSPARASASGITPHVPKDKAAAVSAPVSAAVAVQRTDGHQPVVVFADVRSVTFPSSEAVNVVVPLSEGTAAAGAGAGAASAEGAGAESGSSPTTTTGRTPYRQRSRGSVTVIAPLGMSRDAVGEAVRDARRRSSTTFLAPYAPASAHREKGRESKSKRERERENVPVHD
jgi:hypothetical protein